MSERLKFSQFNIPVGCEEGILVYNSLSRTLIRLSEEMYKRLKNLSNPIESAFLQHIELLKRLKILVPADEDEMKKARQWYDRIRFDQSFMRLSILTTYSCNFACVYCIENGVKDAVHMDEDCSSLTLDWVKNRLISQGGRNLFVLFYGGEPLLNTKPIYYLAENLYRFTQESSISFRFAITTNGYLLNQEIIERLLPYGLSSIKVTLDGDKKAHDKKRPHISGKGSFDRIIQNLLSVVHKVPINLGINVDEENIDSLPLLMDFLEETNLKELIHTIDLNPIMPTIASGISACPCNLNNTDLLSQIVKAKEQICSRGFPVANKLKHVMCGMKQDGGLLVIDPKRKIYTCPAFVGRGEFSVGSLERQELSIRHKRMVNHTIETDCLSCSYFPMCSGGCPYDAYVKTGDCFNTVCQRKSLEKWTKNLILLQYQMLRRTI